MRYNEDALDAGLNDSLEKGPRCGVEISMQNPGTTSKISLHARRTSEGSLGSQCGPGR